jgi:hypothetical protein
MISSIKLFAMLIPTASAEDRLECLVGSSVEYEHVSKSVERTASEEVPLRQIRQRMSWPFSTKHFSFRNLYKIAQRDSKNC